jgi:hypothetical protein
MEGCWSQAGFRHREVWPLGSSRKRRVSPVSSIVTQMAGHHPREFSPCKWRQVRRDCLPAQVRVWQEAPIVVVPGGPASPLSVYVRLHVRKFLDRLPDEGSSNTLRRFVSNRARRLLIPPRDRTPAPVDRCAPRAGDTMRLRKHGNSQSGRFGAADGRGWLYDEVAAAVDLPPQCVGLFVEDR